MLAAAREAFVVGIQLSSAIAAGISLALAVLTLAALPALSRLGLVSRRRQQEVVDRFIARLRIKEAFARSGIAIATSPKPVVPPSPVVAPRPPA